MTTRPTFLSLFAGIGGLDLALEAAGWRCAGQVEADPYCTEVLATHWPDVPRWGDIKEVDWDAVRPGLGPVDLVAAGFPCQPTSQAGRRKAQKDARWLWPEVARCAGVLRPRYVFLENPLGLLHRGFGDVLGDLAALGFHAEWDCVQAADVGAPHERDRVFVLADSGCGGREAHERDLHGRQPDPARRGTAVADTDGWRGDRLHEWDTLGHLATNAEERSPAGRGRCPTGPVADAERGELQRRGGPGVLADPPGTGAGEGPQRQRDGHAARHRGEAVEHAPLVGGEPVGRVELAEDRDPRRCLHLGELEPGVGRDVAGLPGGLDGHRWPAPPGPDQFAWEPPRTIGRGVPFRGRRVKALGNACVPQQALLAFTVLWARMGADP